MRLRGQMKQKSAGRWQLRVYIGLDANGKRIYSAKTFEGTTGQAQKELTAMQGKLDRNEYLAPSRLCVRDYFTRWLEGKIDVSARSQEEYRRQCGYFDAIGHMKLHEVDVSVLQVVLNGMTSRGLSRRTLEYAKAVVHVAFEDAVQQGLLSTNPADHVKLPPKLRSTPAVLSMPQVAELLARRVLDPLHPLWATLLTTGLRPQEALALRWEDLDLEQNQVSIHRVLRLIGNCRYAIVEDTKTTKSVRSLGLPATTCGILKAHRDRQRREMLMAGPRFERNNLVFCSDHGRPLDLSRVRRAWKAALKACDLPVIKLYNARHTHLTALLQAGADIAWIRDRAGHSNIQTTIQHYAHVMPEARREMGDMTERMLKEARNVS